MHLLCLLAAENVETTVEAETVTSVSQQTSEADEDEDEVTPVTDSQTHTGLSVKSFVQQLGISSWHSIRQLPLSSPAMWDTGARAPATSNNNFSAHFAAARTLQQPTLSGFLFHVALKTCEIVNGRRSVTSRKY